eukprot:6645338-Alexandrium_andersonii.AAC.1
MPRGDMSMETNDRQPAPALDPFPPPRPSREAGWVRQGSKGDGSPTAASAQTDPDAFGLPR